ncbi:MAG: NUDIX domain-containing protein [Chitinophagales bacterium]|nr:NUDIX domain-containing protein [Chitinophagales bacterium]
MFNIRVYGLWIMHDHVLLSEEHVKENMVLKFPGGGLEFGEGTIDCLKREFKEELGVEIRIVKHLYTTDFFVRSFLNEKEQVISIYYIVTTNEMYNAIPSFPDIEENRQKFYWQMIAELNPDMFQLPIDKELVKKINGKELEI